MNRLFERVAPGAHGKGGYTGQGRLVVSNNGDILATKANAVAPDIADPRKDTEAARALAEWDGKTWCVVERRQFTDVTGPGGIYGVPDDKAPLWTIGWDKRSIILMLLDGGQWHKFRLPKASHAYDAKHGWYTEWPRIRSIESDIDGQRPEGYKPLPLLMDMSGMFYGFPATFSMANTAGIARSRRIFATFLIFLAWNGRVVIAADDCSIMKNEMAGLSQSNLWFGSAEELKQWGPKTGWGGVWLGDDVKAGQASDPFLINGFDNRLLHLAHNSKEQVDFKLEFDQKGDGKWVEYATASVPAGGYSFYQILPGVKAQWLRVTPSRDCRATAYSTSPIRRGRPAPPAGSSSMAWRMSARRRRPPRPSVRRSTTATCKCSPSRLAVEPCRSITRWTRSSLSVAWEASDTIPKTRSATSRRKLPPTPRKFASSARSRSSLKSMRRR